jgi:hypothetical protein
MVMNYIQQYIPINNNPQYCSPTEDGTCQFNWSVNVTGNIGTDFNLTLIYVSNLTSIDNNQSGIVTINITTDIPPTITLLNPANQSKIIGNGTQELTWFVDDNSAILNCTLYINNIINRTIICPSATNTSVNITFTPGFYEWKIMADDNVTQVNSSNGSFWIIKEYNSKISKRISSVNTDMYLININLTNNAKKENRIIPTDFIDINFNFGSLSPPYNLNSTIIGLYNGTILSWNLTIPSSNNQLINYSITKNTNKYNLKKNFILGFD